MYCWQELYYQRSFLLGGTIFEVGYGILSDTLHAHYNKRLHWMFTSRRTFLLSTAVAPWMSSFAARVTPRILRFGVISDVHQDVMHDGIERISQFVASMRDAQVDFVLQLGDFCQPHPRNRPFLDAWNSFDGPKYHVLGNHDMDGGYAREKTVEFYGMPHRYYTFDSANLRGIVLDTNDPGGTAKGYKKFIGIDQQQWLQKQLSESDRPVCVFLHHPLDDPNGIENRKELREILTAAENAKPGLIVGVFSGHFHQDYTLLSEKIRYIQINSASYVWLGGNSTQETYPAEVHKKHPSLISVAAYEDPLWAVVQIDFEKGELTIEGKSTRWHGPTPWERGASQTDYPSDKNRPAISSASLKL